MKKIIFATLMFAGIISSCDMEKKPLGTLDDETGVSQLSDVAAFRNILYSGLRGKTAGAWLYYSEIQSDLFHGMKDNGNNGGNFNNGTINSADQDIEDLWASMYSTINQANYLIERIEAIGGQEAGEMQLYYGEAHFTRAFCYFWLADHFCGNYADGGEGLPLKMKYEPSADRGTYPGRSSMVETYAAIENDLKIAYNALKANTQPKQNDAYLNYITVAALQARVALVKGDKTTAFNKAKEVIECPVYSLTEIADYARLWKEDTGTEVIFRPVMTNTEGTISSSINYYLTDNEQSAYYIPTMSFLAIYEPTDVRGDVFFTPYMNMLVNGETYPCYVFNKFPGNESLKTGTQRNFANMMKPFRLSEMYLIAAETADNINTQAQYLNDLRAKRILGYEPEVFTAGTIDNAIRNERLKELVGEGFRMSDLRRAKQGFTRGEIQDGLDDAIIEKCKTVSYKSNDYRFVWPIPAVEIQTNPQLDGHQNPGY